ncbi:MAG: VOC family protein [Pseudomonadota bacterium]
MTNESAEPPVAPYLTVKGAKDAITWYQTVFDAEIRGTMPAENDDRLMHASLLINGGLVMLSDEFPEYSPYRGPTEETGSSVAVSLRFDLPDEVDRVYKLAVEQGASGHFGPETMFWGDRFAQLIDPFGHRWMLAAKA